MADFILDTVFLSMYVACISTTFVLLFSLMLAPILIKSRSKIAALVEHAIYVPMALPPVALGYGLLMFLGPNSAVGGALKNVFGLEVAFRPLGAVVAAFMVSFGLGLRTIRLALETIERPQIDNAYILGASRFQVFYYIIFPQCINSILVAGILVFLRALSEFGATMVLAGTSIGGARTLAVAIWIAMETPGQERQCLILVLIAVTLSSFALLMVEMLSKKRS